MTVLDFLESNMLLPEQIPADDCVSALISQMEAGLRGEGNIPMLPSYLSTNITAPKNESCCVLDAGGTNMRSAKAVFDESGKCTIENITKIHMPGTKGELSAAEFFYSIAELAGLSGSRERIGFCFSYNIMLDRTLDGTLNAWCKEVKAPEVPGLPIGACLKAACGEECERVHVLNDSVAAMLGAASESDVSIGLILGTGINVCYEEKCSLISKVPSDLCSESMIISTEVGEFDGIPKSPFDLALFASTEDPELAHAEKQCAGGYLGKLICLVWREATKLDLLGSEFSSIDVPLHEISAMLSGAETSVPTCKNASFIAEILIQRAAKIAAILCAAPILRCTENGGKATIAVEGSHFYKLHSFKVCFEFELEEILRPYGITFDFLTTKHSCLKGAALAAFADTM